MTIAQSNIPVTHNNFFEGLSDMKFLGTKGQLLRSSNMDNVSDPKGLQLAPLPSLLDDYTATTGWDGAFTIFSKYAKRISVTSVGKVYVNGSLVQTIGSCDVMYAMQEFRDKIIFAYLRTGDSSSVYYGFIPVDGSGNLGTPYNPDVRSIAGFGQFTVTIHNYNDSLLLLAAGQRIYQMVPEFITDPTGGTHPIADGNVPTLQLKIRDNIIGIVQSLEQFRIYCVYGDKDHPSKTTVYICNQADIEL